MKSIRGTCFRFAFRLIILTVFASLGTRGFGPALAALLAMAGIFCAIAGAMRRKDVWSRIDALGRGGGLRRHRPSCLHAVLTELPAFQRFLCGAYDIARRSLSNSYTPISKLTAPNESIDKRDFDDRSSPPRQVPCRASDAGDSDAQGDSRMATTQRPVRARPVPPADAREPRGSAPERARSHIDDAATRGGGGARRKPDIYRPSADAPLVFQERSDDRVR